MNITIDGLKSNKQQNKIYRGMGMVSGNNTSRLLLDYKSEHPEKYWEILNYIFGADGVDINHLKIEMGSDINSSSGTEPAVKRATDETADVTRGAGYQLAADAKKIKPDVTLDMLWWSEPSWIGNSDDVYSARYRWYKETLEAAYNVYKIKFDYVSANQNERAIDPEWIKYLSKRLKSETKMPYDFSKIKVVAADEDSSWGISDLMLRDSDLSNAVDIVGSHYNSFSDTNTKKLANEYGKEIWFSEACSPMSYSPGTYRFDGTNSGLTGINGVLDIANRFIAMYPRGDMTLHEFQPVVTAYYDGATFGHKQLITANKPWSGYYSLDSGFFMLLHFTQFFRKGWTFIDDACFNDGEKGGDGHAVVDVKYSYMTAKNPETDDYSTVITNITRSPITYEITVKNLKTAPSDIDIWETRGPSGGSYNENYFKKIGTKTPAENNGTYSYTVVVQPYSIVTLSTVSVDSKKYTAPTEKDDTILLLPYSDDFKYENYPKNYLSSRGNAPRYTTDEGGAFEVQNINGNNVLTQWITPETKAKEWGKTPEPTTNFGDDNWFNYYISVDVIFDKSKKPEENYVGAGLRYNLADCGISGYWIQLFEDGSWNLNRNKKVKAEGKINNFDSSQWTNIKIQAVYNNVSAYINNEKICEYIDNEAVLSAGRAALYSSYNQNSFDNIKINPAYSGDYYIKRYDNTDSLAEYTGEWEHSLMSSFKNYKRTISKGQKNATVTIKFNGTGFAVIGETAKGCIISVIIDNMLEDDNYSVPNAGEKEITYSKYGLDKAEHTAEITVKSGIFAIDCVEILGDNFYD